MNRAVPRDRVAALFCENEAAMHTSSATPMPLVPCAPVRFVAIATFTSQGHAEAAVGALGRGGLDVTHLGVAGRGFHVDQRVTGFYNRADRIRFWGTRGAFWGGLWGLLLGVMIQTAPTLAPVAVMALTGTLAIAALKGALAIGGIAMIAAALYGLGVPRDSVPVYETAMKVDRILVMVDVLPDRIAAATTILDTAGALRVDVHPAPISRG
jgi:hypothetical protein